VVAPSRVTTNDPFVEGSAALPAAATATPDPSSSRMVTVAAVVAPNVYVGAVSKVSTTVS
jgi:hypothetical protein